MSTIYLFQTGNFLTPLWTGPDPTGTAFTSSRTPANVTLRPNQLRNGNLPSSQQSVSQWFDLGAFGAPSPGSFGTSAKGVIIGPGATSVHAGIAKLFRFHETMQIRWDLIANNVINHPNWSNPGLNISSQAQAGIITSTAGVTGLDESGARFLRVG